jgi:hypothetical protein
MAELGILIYRTGMSGRNKSLKFETEIRNFGKFIVTLEWLRSLSVGVFIYIYI